MADFNPLSYLPDPKDFTGSNPYGTIYLPGFFAANMQREQAAAPFIQMAKQAEQQKIDQSSQMNPLLLAEKRGTNQQTNLQNDRYGQMTPFEVAGAGLKNDASRLANDATRMTNEVTAAGHSGAMRAAQEKPYNDIVASFSASLPRILETPAMNRVGAYAQAAEAAMSNISDPGLREQFKREFMTNPTWGMEKLRSVYDNKYKTPTYTQATDVAKIGADASIKGHQISAGATIRAAEIREQGAKALKQMEQDSPKNAKVMVLKSRAWLAAPPDGATQDEFYKHQGIVAAAEEEEAMNAYKAYVGGQEAITDSHPSKGGVKSQDYFRQQVKDRYRNVGGNPTPRPGPTNDAAQIQRKVLESGVQYEPDKYEYRIAPDGSVQRKAK